MIFWGKAVEKNRVFVGKSHGKSGGWEKEKRVFHMGREKSVLQNEGRCDKMMKDSIHFPKGAILENEDHEGNRT